MKNNKTQPTKCSFKTENLFSLDVSLKKSVKNKSVEKIKARDSNVISLVEKVGIRYF